MHFVLTSCREDLFGAVAHTDPVLWPQRWEVILPLALRQGAEGWLLRPWFAFSHVSSPLIDSLFFWLIIIWYLLNWLSNYPWGTSTFQQLNEIQGILESYLSCWEEKEISEELVFPLSHFPFYLSLLQRDELLGCPGSKPKVFPVSLSCSHSLLVIFLGPWKPGL